MSKKEKYLAKAGAHEAVAELISGALENGEFKDLSELEIKEVGTILKRLERAVVRNFEYADNPPTKPPRKPKPRVSKIKIEPRKPQVINPDDVFDLDVKKRGRR